MTVHTSALDHAIAEAVHHTDAPHADAVSFKVHRRAADGTPALYTVVASRRGRSFTAYARTPGDGLALAMSLLTAEAEAKAPLLEGGASDA